MTARICTLISILPQNGAKYLTTNLGFSLKKKKRKSKVLLIDFDFQDPTLCLFCTKDLNKGLDKIEPFGSDVTKDQVISNIVKFEDAPDILKGSTLRSQALFSQATIIKVINYVKVDYDYIFIVCNPSLNPATTVSLLNSDEILLVIRNNYGNLLNALNCVKALEAVRRDSVFNVVENYSSATDTNVLRNLKDYNLKYIGSLAFDENSVDNIDLTKKSIFKQNQNKSVFLNILKSMNYR